MLVTEQAFWYTKNEMKRVSLLTCFSISVVFALPVRPVLPSVEYLDTETVTNMPFTAWQEHLRYFTFKLAFNATPSLAGQDPRGDEVEIMNKIR